MDIWYIGFDVHVYMYDREQHIQHIKRKLFLAILTRLYCCAFDVGF